MNIIPAIMSKQSGACKAGHDDRKLLRHFVITGLCGILFL